MKRRQNNPERSLILLALSLAWCFGSSGLQADARLCEQASSETNGEMRVFTVGSVWSGTSTRPGALRTPEGKLLIAYYDADRWVTLASLDEKSRELCRVRLPSRFGGWDAHNNLAVARASDGSIHIAGNAHATPLFYARAANSDIETVRATAMIGSNEANATYPTFLRDANGDLLFLYREGRSGDGTWLINRWHSGRWSRIGSAFASADNFGSVSAYPTNIETDNQGVSHVAVVWRRNYDVRSNFAISYAQTRDFLHWSRLNETPTIGPLDPSQMDTIDAPGEGHGLLNSGQLLLSNDGIPIVFYIRYGDNGNDAIFVSKPSHGRWIKKEIARSPRRSLISGGGTISGLPSISATNEGNKIRATAIFPPSTKISLFIEPTTLTITSAPSASSAIDLLEPLPLPRGIGAYKYNNMLVRASDVGGTILGRLNWYSQLPDRDRPLRCTYLEPRACNPPPSPLRWIVDLRE